MFETSVTNNRRSDLEFVVRVLDLIIQSSDDKQGRFYLDLAAVLRLVKQSINCSNVAWPTLKSALLPDQRALFTDKLRRTQERMQNKPDEQSQYLSVMWSLIAISVETNQSFGKAEKSTIRLLDNILTACDQTYMRLDMPIGIEEASKKLNAQSANDH
jgi:hypothetical protein